MCEFEKLLTNIFHTSLYILAPIVKPASECLYTYCKAQKCIFYTRVYSNLVHHLMNLFIFLHAEFMCKMSIFYQATNFENLTFGKSDQIQENLDLESL